MWIMMQIGYVYHSYSIMLGIYHLKIKISDFMWNQRQYNSSKDMYKATDDNHDPTQEETDHCIYCFYTFG